MFSFDVETGLFHCFKKSFATTNSSFANTSFSSSVIVRLLLSFFRVPHQHGFGLVSQWYDIDDDKQDIFTCIQFRWNINPFKELFLDSTSQVLPSFWTQDLKMQVLLLDSIREKMMMESNFIFFSINPETMFFHALLDLQK